MSIYIRISHWAIENKLHWVLDIAFREDDIGINDRIAAENLSLIRKVAHTLMKETKAKNMSFKRQRKRYGHRPDLLFGDLAHEAL